MGPWDSWRKHIAGNNRIISLLIAATTLFLVIFSSFLPSSHDVETTENSRVKVYFSIPPSSSSSSHNFDYLVPSVSPLRNSFEAHKNNISEEIDNGGEAERVAKNRKGGGRVRAGVVTMVEAQKRYSNGANESRLEIMMVDNLASPKESESDGEGCDPHQFVNMPSNRSTETKTKVEQSMSFHSHARCDIYEGKWVHDDTYPLYPAGECPYMSAEFNCKQNGRQDSDYTRWRWQPTHFHLPRLNTSDMLERLRGKRLMFVGDSINRNQWESLICILRTVVPDNEKTFGRSKGGATASFDHSMYTKKKINYNCSVEFFWAPFLIEQDSINIANKNKEILRLDAIENHGTDWRGVDILVFNTGHWWTHGNKVDSRDFYTESGYLHPQLAPLVAFQKGLTAWANWIDQNIDPTETKVFFRGFSPMHFSSRQWNKPGGHKCNFETEPIFEESYINPYPERMKTMEEVLGRMKFPVSLMNITRLSDSRKDAHPSLSTLRKKKRLTQQQRRNPDQFGDCSHWCLPGLPDIWNELLYASLLLHTHMDASPSPANHHHSHSHSHSLPH